MSKRRRAERFHAACERLGDKRSIARIEKRHAQSVPFASGSEHACRITLCLLKDGLRTDGYFFRLDDSKQPCTASAQ